MINKPCECILDTVDNCIDTIETLNNYKFTPKKIAVQLATLGDALIFDSLISEFFEL